jgi:hypothetical protein
MHPYLTKLGVPGDVQEFFNGCCTTDGNNNLAFTYGDSAEIYGLAFHRIPSAKHLWIAGNTNYNLIKWVFICSSAMEAVALLSLNSGAFCSYDPLLFVATGLRPQAAQINRIMQNLRHRTIALVFSGDLLGRVTDLKMAAGIRKVPAAVTVNGNTVHVRCRYRDYPFSHEEFSLNAFEKASGFRFKIRTLKSKTHESFLAQLQAAAFSPL